MKDIGKLREFLADKEHQQWIAWSEHLADFLHRVRVKSSGNEEVREMIKERLESWSANWKPYAELPELVKDLDREWADKILDELPIRCPVYQCGGLMTAVDDDQTPKLKCSNCSAIYAFEGFDTREKKRRK